MKIYSIDLIKSRYRKEIVFICAAGFEERCLGIVGRLKLSGVGVRSSIVIDYSNDDLNEPVKGQLVDAVRAISPFMIMPVDRLSEIEAIVDSLKFDCEVVVDVTGMSHPLIFEVLSTLEKCDCKYDVVYTEAESYSPEKAFYERLVDGHADKEEAFSNYLEFERSESVYSSNCEVVQYPKFVGNPEPGRPGFLLTFMTFKRSRLQVILQEMDFDKKIYIISEPERSDLKWRKDMMEIANWDIVEKNGREVFKLSTLNVECVVDFLESNTYGNNIFSQYNIYLSPLGSKMQTFGCFLFWKKHPEIGIVFSQPKWYYKDSYSKGMMESYVGMHEDYS